MTDTNNINPVETGPEATAADSSPAPSPEPNLLTSKQFLSFETMAIGIFALFVAICGYVWNSQAEEFKVLKNDVKTISLVIPTLATKAEMDQKLDSMDKKVDAKFAAMNEKVDARFAAMDKKMDDRFATVDRKFEKVDDKLDTLISSVNTLQTTLVTKVSINSYRLDQLEKNNKKGSP